MVEFATVQVTRETKALLAAAKLPGETYDHLVRRKLREADAEAERAFFAEIDAILDDRAAMQPLR